jgi:multidrug efflux pump subunit AcrB
MSQSVLSKIREFKLSTVAVDNATSIFLLTFMILFFGIRSYQQMPKEQYPDASMPTIFINTPHFGNSAEDIENLVTRPMEKEIKSIVGLKSLISTSMQDYSTMVAEFESDVVTSEALLKVKDAVDKADLPSDLETEPAINELDFGEIPIMVVNISGEYNMDDLRNYAEFVQDKIEEIPEISEARMSGDLEREVKINMDLLKMQASQISFGDIEGAIARENITMSGGELVNNGNRRAIRVIGEFASIKEIQDLIITAERQKPIYLRDIGDVEYSFEERTSYSRSDGAPVISLEIIKRSGENLLSTADKIKVVIDDLNVQLPDELSLTLFNDQSLSTRNEVSNLENSIISGVILVILILLFFLGFRNALFVGLAIPISMLMGIMILYISGVTINIVVLFGLILALGLLVDNGIVVVENIYRYQQNGYNGKDSAKYGAGEVAWPIIASTATTLAAFLPLIMWPGIMGIFMQYLPITLIIVLSSSLFVALVINPVLTSRFMKVDEKAETKALRRRKTKNILLAALLMVIIAIIAHFASIEPLRNILGIVTIFSLLNHFILRPASLGFQGRVLPKLERGYNTFINFVLKGWAPGLTLLGTFLLMIVAIGLLVASKPKVEFFPSSDPLYINAFVELPFGSDIEKTNAVTLELERKINEVIKPYSQIVESVLTQIGENTTDPNQPPVAGVTPYRSRITITFVEYKYRNGVSTKDVLNKIREEIQGYPGVEIVIGQNANGPPTGQPVNLEIRGDDIDSLINISSRLINDINGQNIAGIEELRGDVQLEKPELLVDVDREASRRYGVSTGQIASTLRTSIFGKEVSKFKVGEDEYPIVLRLKDKSRNNITKLINQRITFRDQSDGQVKQVPISSVASFRYSATYNAIKRKDGQRVITIASNILDGYNANDINAELESYMSLYDLPDGYSYAFTGEQQQQAEDSAFLASAFLVALFIIFIIIVTQFNSFISPFIIILSVFFSTIGVFLGYFITGKTINIIFTGVGIISLAGIVVNNAIVLIDYINLTIERKRLALDIDDMNDMSLDDVKSSIIEGGATRLRPVLLTAITTVLGLIPLAVGFNINFFSFVKELDPKFFLGGDNTAMWGPMAWTIIYGIIFATFLTLIVVPVMYWLAYRIKRKIMTKKQPNSLSLQPISNTTDNG